MRAKLHPENPVGLMSHWCKGGCGGVCTEGFEVTLNGRKPDKPPREKTFDGEQEAKVIALRLGSPPKGFANWSLRLLADRVVELQIVETVCYETIRQTLKKTA
jgi:hypothetical protein